MVAILAIAAFAIVAGVAVGAGVLAPQNSEPPRFLNYQGQLTQPSGASVADASYSATFRIFDAPVGGAELWSESQQVATRGGIYSTTLGKSTPFPASLFTKRLWLESEVEGRVLVPRHELASVAFAMTALSALSVAPGAIDESSLAPGMLVPVGSVVAWWGNSAAVPDGWKLCDGTSVADPGSPLNGLTVPNLVNRFIRGATGNVQPTAPSGGSDTIDLAHSHTVNSHSHSIDHSHNGTTNPSSASIDYYRYQPDGYTEVHDNHTHTFTTNGPSNPNSGASSPGTNSQLSSSQSIVPAYIGLVYIMRVR